ncbi:MAG: nuclear transport factor 2 family protein [Gammaproteobacteria bacterium]|nr:nuclear transport factor 2 family protein [Gammaproteobacteria bacterium]
MPSTSQKESTVFATASECEIAFYRAFAECNPGGMKAVWHSDKPVCIHPGATPLVGLEAILASWNGILGNSLPPDLRIKTIKRMDLGSVQIHIVEEQVNPDTGTAPVSNILLATNVYLLTEQGWKMTEHHASTTLVSQASRPPSDQRLH